VAGYKQAGIAAAMGEQEAERESKKATGECQAEHEACTFAQGCAESARDFKQWNQDEQADGKMDDHGMEAAEELLPIGVRAAVEFDEPGKRCECQAQNERGDP
jgi:hypothetical protein